jgi:hypothetical protein
MSTHKVDGSATRYRPPHIEAAIDRRATARQGRRCQRTRWRVRQRVTGRFIWRPRSDRRATTRQGRRCQHTGWRVRQRATGRFIRRPRSDRRATARQGRRCQHTRWRVRQRAPSRFIWRRSDGRATAEQGAPTESTSPPATLENEVLIRQISLETG